ncbi:unnamed protein product [Mesocestoides corti]|uniref:C2H2-type domain-containing protein n=1 Tax=Mesocestoides corti TaxID=53468 RepID=A0A0R3U328_MESCO|nr:unnamed protein product [Mesocestoides corti]
MAPTQAELTSSIDGAHHLVAFVLTRPRDWLLAVSDIQSGRSTSPLYFAFTDFLKCQLSSTPQQKVPAESLASSQSIQLTSSSLDASSNDPCEVLDLRVNSRKTVDEKENAALISWNLARVNALYQDIIKRFQVDISSEVDAKTRTGPVEDESEPSSVVEHGAAGDGGKEPLLLYHPEPPGCREVISEMLRNRDSRLQYINDGAAIVNPFAVDRKEQLEDLMKMLCYVNDENQYACRGCGRVTPQLKQMHQHLLSHSSSKFHLCVHCLKGFNDKYDMKRHTRKHTMVKPFRCPECGRGFSQRCSLEGHRRKVHQVVLSFAPHERREVLRVCERCGFSCNRLEDLLQHTERRHPTDVHGITRLRRRVVTKSKRRA